MVVPGLVHGEGGGHSLASGKGAPGEWEAQQAEAAQVSETRPGYSDACPGVVWGYQAWASWAEDLCDPAVLGLSTIPWRTARACTSRAANRSSTPWTATTAIA